MHPPPDLSELAERHARFLYRVAFNLLRHPQDAEDAVQETLLKLLRTNPSNASWPEVQDERAYLAAAVWRVGLNRLSSAHGKAMRHAQDISEMNLPTQSPNPEQLAANSEAQRLMRGLIEALPDTLRQPLLLAAIDGMRSREVSSILGIPEATVRTRIHRAKAELREAFQTATTAREVRA